MRGTRNRRTGAVLVEFVLGAGILVAAFAGTWRFGYTFLQYNQLESAVMRGARLAAVMPYDSNSTTPSAAYGNAVRNMVVYGRTTAEGAALVRGLTVEHVRLAVTFTNGVPAEMTVSISGYPIIGSWLLNNKPSVTYPYQGIWAPL